MTVSTSPPGATGPERVADPHGQRSQPHLPVPPTDAEKELYADRNVALINRTSLVSFGALLVGQIGFVLISPDLLALAPLIAVTLVYFTISMISNLGARGFDLAAHRRLTGQWRPQEYPSLDVFLPVCGEPIAVLRNTWVHVARLLAAYPGAATGYVLDDGDSAQARELAGSVGLRYAVRPDRGRLKRAGNLQYGLGQSTGEFILVLDADFAPRADLPAELIPYLSADPTLGIVQSPQYFHTQGRMSWIERGAGAVQELFYRLVQVSRDRHDGAICVGSCAVYRRTALAANRSMTLIEHSEDVHTGFDLRQAGWGLRYVPIPLATGLCPPDPDSFLAQQYRWCAGSMSLLGSRKFWSAPMRARTRFCYLSGFLYYVHTALLTFATPVIPLVMLVLLPDRVRLLNYVFILPSIVYNLVVFPAWHHGRFGPSAFMAKLLYGWAHLFALWDIARGRRLGWQPTAGPRRKSKTRRIWTGIALWNGSTSAAWVLLALYRTLTDSTSFGVLLVAGLMSAAVTIMALLSRGNYAMVEAERGAA
ncbi:MAG TPA: glycosyltransferase family 2 protein [Trebonia sp.]|nr:glycosyltransferase family 2 protein [Trebonia sp.]